MLTQNSNSPGHPVPHLSTLSSGRVHHTEMKSREGRTDVLMVQKHPIFLQQDLTRNQNFKKAASSLIPLKHSQNSGWTRKYLSHCLGSFWSAKVASAPHRWFCIPTHPGKPSSAFGYREKTPGWVGASLPSCQLYRGQRAGHFINPHDKQIFLEGGRSRAPSLASFLCYQSCPLSEEVGPLLTG